MPNVRAPLKRPLTEVQSVIATLLAHGHNNADIAERLHMHVETVRYHMKEAAKKIESDLPAQMRVVMWARGAPQHALTTEFIATYQLGK